MMNAPGTEPSLGNLESPSLAEQHVRGRHAYVLERHLAMPVRRIVIAEYRQHPAHGDAGRVHRHQDHRLLLMPGRGGIGLAHEDGDAAARVAGS